MKAVATLLTLLFGLAACGPGAPGRAIEDAALVRAARDVVAVAEGYNCELLPTHLPGGAQELFAASIGPDLMDGMQDPVERVCFVLGVIQDYPYSESMEVRAHRITEAGADLLLLGEGIRAELSFVREGGAWKLDPRWALKQVQDLSVHQALRMFAINQDGFRYGRDRFTESSAELSEATHTVTEFFPGIARHDLPPMYVYAALGPGARSVCGSSLSLSGELFMIRAAADGSASYARGTLPSMCPGRPLGRTW
jgi:hypothetical protein